MSTYDLKSPPTPLNGSPSSVISGITTPFSLRNIDQYDNSVKNSTKIQSSKNFPDNSIDVEGTNLMSTFDKKSLKRVTIKSITTSQSSTYKTVKSNSYITSPSINNDINYDNFNNITYELYVP